MKVRGDFLGPPRSTDKTTLKIKVSKVAKIRNRYNQVPHLTQDTRSSSDLKCGTRHRGYPGTGIMEGDCTHNPENWKNKSKFHAPWPDCSNPSCLIFFDHYLSHGT